MIRKPALALVGLALALVSLIACVVFVAWVFVIRTTFEDHKVEAQPTPAVVEKARPISDVKCSRTYQLEHTELYYPDKSGRVARNFTFGGWDRNLRPQYIWNENVIGQLTEVRSARRVDRSLKYSEVTFLCLSDPVLEGHKASNIEVMRYRLTLRRPLRPQTVIRPGGPARQ